MIKVTHIYVMSTEKFGFTFFSSFVNKQYFCNHGKNIVIDFYKNKKIVTTDKKFAIGIQTKSKKYDCAWLKKMFDTPGCL